ncbi:hypothetical protein HPB49_002072 [Dermacentor silvarum]|uniref:Uncharacterized protein n=1 Tax=Dermacentor silvarum TaxID=543639 RepID=A0ACB8C6X4_DERSI|nr:hypothetical protein HPB49_002072 [Dermacentor silvarum]
MYAEKEMQTLDEILTAANEDDDQSLFSKTTLWRLLHDNGFPFEKRKRKPALIELDVIIAWRRRYLRAIKEFWKQGRHPPAYPPFARDRPGHRGHKPGRQTMTNNPKAAAAAAGARAPASEAASPRRRQRVAVIGAGASGLTAVKACLEEGLDVVCYERTDVLAGLWHYTDTVERGRACVMRSTVINSSKEMSAFSDFPPDDTLPNYMHNSHMARYIVDYGRRCGAVDRVLLRHEVADVRPTRPGSEDTTWTLRVRRLDSEGGGDREEFEDERDAVMVCTGHHAHPLWPRFKGLGDERGEGRVFAGRVMHSQDYRTSRGFEDRRVLVIGVGNSAGDLAVELGGVAEQVTVGEDEEEASRCRSVARGIRSHG